MSMNDPHFLYTKSSSTPILCERDDWRKCPEHKHLSDELPTVESLETLGISNEEFVDDPNDDIVSPREYTMTVGLMGASVDPEYEAELRHIEGKDITDPHLYRRAKVMDAVGRGLATVGGLGGIVGATMLAPLGAVGIGGGLLLGTPFMALGLFLAEKADYMKFEAGANLGKPEEWVEKAKARIAKRQSRR
jgi:hypothetical protein